MTPIEDRHREAAREIDLELPTSVLDQGVIVALGVSEAAAQYEEHLAAILAKHFPFPSSGTGELVEALRGLMKVVPRSYYSWALESEDKIRNAIAICDEALRKAEAGREPEPDYRCGFCGDILKQGPRDMTTIHFVPCPHSELGDDDVIADAFVQARKGADSKPSTEGE